MTPSAPPSPWRGRPTVSDNEGWLPVGHMPQPSDICSVCGDGLVHISAANNPATLRAALDGLIAAVESSSVRPDHLSHQHPQWPQTECDECYAIRREQYDALRAALATAKEAER